MFWTYPTWLWSEKPWRDMETSPLCIWEIAKLGKWGERHVVIAMSVLTAGHLEMTQRAWSEKSWYNVAVQLMVQPNSPPWVWWNNMGFHMIPLSLKGFCEMIVRNTLFINIHHWFFADGPAFLHEETPGSRDPYLQTGSHHPLAIWNSHPCGAFPWLTYWSTLCVWALDSDVEKSASWVPRCRKCWEFVFDEFSCLADHLVFLNAYKLN